MKKIIFLALSLLAVSAQAWTQRAPAAPEACAVHVPYGMPQVQKPDATLICQIGRAHV